MFKVMAIKEFADFIISAPMNKEIAFCSEWDVNTKVIEEYNCSDWYGFKKIDIFDAEEHEPLVIFGWYGGGSEACTRMNNSLENFIKSYIHDFMLGTAVEDHICVEIEAK